MVGPVDPPDQPAFRGRSRINPPTAAAATGDRITRLEKRVEQLELELGITPAGGDNGER